MRRNDPMPLCACAVCGEPIYSVDDSTYLAELRDGKETTDPNEILADGQNLDGKSVHEDCVPSTALHE